MNVTIKIYKQKINKQINVSRKTNSCFFSISIFQLPRLNRRAESQVVQPTKSRSLQIFSFQSLRSGERNTTMSYRTFAIRTLIKTLHIELSYRDATVIKIRVDIIIIFQVKRWMTK